MGFAGLVTEPGRRSQAFAYLGTELAAEVYMRSLVLIIRIPRGTGLPRDHNIEHSGSLESNGSSVDARVVTCLPSGAAEAVVITQTSDHGRQRSSSWLRLQLVTE